MCVCLERDKEKLVQAEWDNGGFRKRYLQEKKMLLIDYLSYLIVLKAFIILTESFHVLRDRCIKNRKWNYNKGIPHVSSMNSNDFNTRY